MKNKLTLAGVAALAVFMLACSADGIDSDVSGSSGEGGAPAGAVASGEPNPDTSEAPKTLEQKVGDTIEVSNDSQAIKYTVTKTQQKSGTQFIKPDYGVYLLAYLEVNVTKGNTYVCSCELSFIGPDGTVYESTFTVLDGVQLFESADVAAGQKKAGWVPFDVPKNAVKGGKIQLKVTNFLSEDQYAYWVL
ncbi:DUF4352 domain-containing protein [Polymorphospora lycopeni]|uniref:DUF4352 domain-containing protein n=1 Tax=Polymorphospora lycopeni TaxID=3140240 RepID=A0ABV5CL36_9ACTN